MLLVSASWREVGAQAGHGCHGVARDEQFEVLLFEEKVLDVTRLVLIKFEEGAELVDR